MRRGRLLERAGLEPQELEFCIRKDLRFSKDVLAATEFELMNTLDQPLESIRKIVEQVAKKEAPACCTVAQLAVSPGLKHIPTGVAPLDVTLHGGLPVSSITEVTGPSGVGKTQFSHMMAVIAAIPPEMGGLGSGVLFVDTEGSFSSERTLDIAHNIAQPCGKTTISDSDLLSRITVFSIKTTSDLLATFSSIDDCIVDRNVRLLIVDSIASVVRKEFPSELTAKRQEILCKVAEQLKFLADTFGLGVLVTNQVTTANKHSPTAVSSDVVASLGLAWYHFVNTRIVFQYQSQTVRQLIITKSSMSPVVSMLYHITAKGIEAASDPAVQVAPSVDPNNFWGWQSGFNTSSVVGQR